MQDLLEEGAREQRKAGHGCSYLVHFRGCIKMSSEVY